MKQPLFILICFLTITSCRQSSRLTENDKTTIISEVNHMLDNYYSDIRKLGLKAEFKYLDTSEDFFWVPPGYSGPVPYRGIIDAINQNALKYKSVDNSFNKLLIIPLTRELATYTGQLNSTMTDTSGKVVSMMLVETGLVIKRKEGWRLLSGQTTLLGQ